MNAIESTSTRPYLVRALYEWCTDNGFTPYVAVAVDDTVQVPREYVKNGEIVLNVSYDATSALTLGNEFIEFKARFAGSAREIMVPIGRVIAIYARENGQGMAFPLGHLTATDALASRSGPRLQAAPDAPPRSESDNKVVQLLPHDSHASDAQIVDGSGNDRGGDAFDAPDDQPEPPRHNGGGARPSLKRVK